MTTKSIRTGTDRVVPSVKTVASSESENNRSSHNSIEKYVHDEGSHHFGSSDENATWAAASSDGDLGGTEAESWPWSSPLGALLNRGKSRRPPSPSWSIISNRKDWLDGRGRLSGWEAASALYLVILTAVGALFVCALLAFPAPTERVEKPWSSRKVVTVAPLSNPSSTPNVDGTKTKRRRTHRTANAGVGTVPSRRPANVDTRRPSECVPAAASDVVAKSSASASVPDDYPPKTEIVLQPTPAERRRFLAARDGDSDAASEMLKKYLKWSWEHAPARTDHSESDDIKVERGGESGSDRRWRMACEAASRSMPDEAPSCPPPSVVYWAVDDDDDDGGGGRPMRSHDGRTILQHIPARIDPSLASGKYYALALALFLDISLDRESDEKFCVVIDARPGIGWGNVPAPKLVPFIKHAAALLSNLHPERLASCILFPMPFWARGLWNMVRPFLDPDTAEKVNLVAGSDRVDSKPPSKLTKYFEQKAVDLMERRRVGCFGEGAVQ